MSALSSRTSYFPLDSPHDVGCSVHGFLQNFLFLLTLAIISHTPIHRSKNVFCIQPNRTPKCNSIQSNNIRTILYRHSGSDLHQMVEIQGIDERTSGEGDPKFANKPGQQTNRIEVDPFNIRTRPTSHATVKCFPLECCFNGRSSSSPLDRLRRMREHKLISHFSSI